MPTSIKELFTSLDACHAEVPLETLVSELSKTEIPLDDIEDYIKFDDRTYKRNLCHCGPGYEALVLCWKDGQASPIHDHHGSICGVKVLKGTLTETRFGYVDGKLTETGQSTLQEGQVCGSQDADIHEIANFQADGTELITLHIYAPGLKQFFVYDRETGQKQDFHGVMAELLKS